MENNKVMSPANCLLIADDDLDDQLMMKKAFANVKFDRAIHTVNNGEELLDFLLRKGKYSEMKEALIPRLILLDLNMPKKCGKTALKEMKTHPVLSKIPVVVFSTSNDEGDISESYKLGANSYISKPSSFTDLQGIAETVDKYWFRIVSTPNVVL
jgi:CheY-like chemotaxis protein